MDSYNASLAPPNGASISGSTADGIVARAFAGVTAWSIVLTALAVLVVYDQSTFAKYGFDSLILQIIQTRDLQKLTFLFSLQ